ncbi:hypothetical protein B5C34_15610 [Pacificimonas flava]|uniref:Uncharacterized protein n=2 Tax=Pacificimonas TaxID=1960290 RepID=A0A219B0T9_9SPHN|nr:MULTISPECIES: hypothetical protein [Pacificimonas]MBZ6379608.1 hypothetical protein [Pacificimonas aurantium]OWV31920.1 hypothetical protein B5C34_15610 [Pacificimonas flava]
MQQTTQRYDLRGRAQAHLAKAEAAELPKCREIHLELAEHLFLVAQGLSHDEAIARLKSKQGKRLAASS